MRAAQAAVCSAVAQRDAAQTRLALVEAGATAEEIASTKAGVTQAEAALAQAGVGFSDVVRVRYILPDRHEFEPCWPLLKAAFGDNPPAATMIECGLIDPKYRIEIEVTALAP